MTVPDEGALLQQLSAQIERDVLAVHHTCAETITEQLIALFFFCTVKLCTKQTRRSGRSALRDADLGGSAATWAGCRWLWSGSGPSCCTAPRWSPSPCSRRTWSASVGCTGARSAKMQRGSRADTHTHRQAAAHRVRDVKDAPDVERRVGAVVQRVARLVEGLGDVAVELLVLPVADLLGLHHPQRLLGDRGQVTIKTNDSPKQTNELISVVLSDYFSFVLQRNMKHF